MTDHSNANRTAALIAALGAADADDTATLARLQAPAGRPWRRR